MVERGFIVRHRSETDRRVVTLALTARGRDMVEALAPKMMHFWNGLLSGFSHEEVDSLINFLTRLMIAADSKPGKKSRLLVSDVPIAKPIVRPGAAKAGKIKRAS
jgi:hypothetical protein